MNDDLISRSALTAEIKSMSISVSGEDIFPQSAKDSVLVHIVTQPTIDAVPVIHAHWTDKGSLSCRCSHCGCKATDEFPYCPHCYARMDAPDGSGV